MASVDELFGWHVGHAYAVRFWIDQETILSPHLPHDD